MRQTINEIEEDPIEEEDSFLEHSRNEINEMSDDDFIGWTKRDSDRLNHTDDQPLLSEKPKLN